MPVLGKFISSHNITVSILVSDRLSSPQETSPEDLVNSFANYLGARSFAKQSMLPFKWRLQSWLYVQLQGYGILPLDLHFKAT